MTAIFKKIIAMFAVILQLFGIFQMDLGIKVPDFVEDFIEDVVQSDEEVQAENREMLEEIAKLLGAGDEVKDMSYSELDELVEKLLKGSDDENASDAPSTDNQPNYEDKEDDFNEDGEIQKPFDEVFPDYMEDETVEYDDETVLVKLSNDFDGKVTSAMKKAGVAKLEKMFSMEKSSWYEVYLKKGSDTKETVESLRQIDDVELVEYNFAVKTTAMDDYEELDANVTSNKLVAHQWHLNYCGINKGYKELDNKGGSSSVIVAVIDTGVDFDHEDLHDNIWVNEKEIPDNGRDDDGNGYVDDYYGVNIITGKGNADDDNGHGTHVAGIIAAQNNHLGTVGIAYNTKIMPIKAAMASGYLYQSDIAKAVLYAYENGAEVINMSFGGSTCSIAVQDALSTAYTRCVLVASAGNDAFVDEKLYPAVPNYPAALSYVIGVMSVGRNGEESRFTNFDYKPFTTYEYEVYAPGEEIISTVPDNKYASWSGTSMAAPMVSAVAALLRSQYSDRNTYPTKFIYGQITATSENQAVCPGHKDYNLDPYKHNVPNIINLESALTKLPKPEVGLSDYYVFDTAGSEADTNGKNNGDGVIDAGETIALGMTLRNRWGMSEDTIVTIDTLSTAGIADPYIEIINPTVDYGSIGTYSTGDCGKLYTDELFTGWKSPFYIRIADDCPNDYIFRINVNISCKNALDAKDKAVYKSEEVTIELTVRNGYVLPSIIDKDMTLTPDNLYIIPNATTILEGVTVKVEPGTHIQFWTNDAEDPYADEYIAYLRVEGKFLVEGTAEEMVYIYPSDFMRNYIVNIYETNNGYVSLKYADIDALYYSDNLTISFADNCIFRKNYSGIVRYRILSAGSVVDTQILSGNIRKFKKVENSVFYKIGNGTYTSKIGGCFENCAFIDCGIDFSAYSDNQYINCLFYGNNFKSDTSNNYVNSSYAAKNPSSQSIDPSEVEVVYVPETGTTYVASKTYINEDYFNGIGLKYAIIETEEELNYLQKTSLSSPNQAYMMGITFKSNKTYWNDGSEVGDFIESTGHTNAHLNIYNKDISGYVNRRYLLEFPGEIYVSDISFAEYEVNVDLDTNYTIKPITQPIPFDSKDLIFESTNENIAKVDANGVVTPVSKGSVDIYVYSKDRAVRNYVTVNVVDYVALEDICFDNYPSEMEVGTTFNLICGFYPADTTRKNVTYTSSNPEIISVNENGLLTANSRGNATITATCEGVETEIVVETYKKATSLKFKDLGKVYVLSDEKATIPELEYGETDPIITYKSTDTSVIDINNNELIFKSSGRVTLRATDERTGLNAETTIYVTSDNRLPVIKRIEVSDCILNGGVNCFILFDDGRVYDVRTKKFIREDVKDFKVSNYGSEARYYNMIFIQNDGSVYAGHSYNGYEKVEGLTDIVEVFTNYGTYFAIDINGACYAWGDGDCSGTGISGAISEPKMINLENVKEVYSSYCGSCDYSYFLTGEGDLYYAGGDSEITYPMLVATDVEDIASRDRGGCYALKEGLWYYAKHNGVIETKASWKYDAVVTTPGYTIIDGKPYRFTSLNSQILIPYLNDVVDIINLDGDTYILCKNNTLYGYGENLWSELGGGSSLTYVPETEAVIVPTFNYVKKQLAFDGSNLNNNILEESKLILDFNGVLKNYNGSLYADENQIPYKLTVDLDSVEIALSDGFKEGVNYKYVVSASDISCDYLSAATEDIVLEFTYKAKDTENSEPESKPEATPEAPVIHESYLDESVERFYYTAENFCEKVNHFINNYNPYFYGNVILNRISTDTNVDHWLRVVAPTSSTFATIPFGGNYWGTVNERAIGLQIVDYTDFQTYAKINYAPYLTEAPENTFPFVTDVKIFNENGEEVTTVANEKITVRVSFNRDMEESIPLSVKFGSAVPYGDYEIEGAYVDARTWEGTTTLSTIIENGNQYFTISNGKAKGTNLKFYTDSYRFGFVIDTTAAQALIMQGSATDEGIELNWTQDDFDTLMGYNVYRSTSEDGYYQRLNSSVIPSETKTFFDDTVEPGVVYYYNFTVVKTDLTESTPSGKISIMSKDTMAPNIYHTPVYTAKTGSNIIISATITDNLAVNTATVYYRTVGTDEWKMAVMNKLNDKYSAIIYAEELSLDGIEYYIDAFDGISHTYKGSQAEPYVIAIQEALDDNALGDVNGDGKITNLDALMLLQAINDLLNLDADQFARADLNGDGVLVAAEALRILQYVSGTVGSVKM